jgi:uncharacterized membrane protein
MQFETTVQIEAPEQAVWAALIDVQGWPQWTDSMRDVRWIDDDGMRIGARARISQPGTPTLVWTVSGIDAGRAFTWETSSPGVKTVGTHVVRAAGEHGSTLTLGLKQSGALAGLVNALFGARTRKYVQMEADGLKRAAESAAAADATEADSAAGAAESGSSGRAAESATVGRAAEAAAAGRGAGVRPTAG